MLLLASATTAYFLAVRKIYTEEGKRCFRWLFYGVVPAVILSRIVFTFLFWHGRCYAPNTPTTCLYTFFPCSAITSMPCMKKSSSDDLPFCLFKKQCRERLAGGRKITFTLVYRRKMLSEKKPKNFIGDPRGGDCICKYRASFVKFTSKRSHECSSCAL